MGKTFVDTYSLLHFATGIVAYYFGIPLIWWIILHAVFEILENSPEGVYFINSLGDEVFAVLGWLLPYFLFHNK
jgi:hypothetical protein